MGSEASEYHVEKKSTEISQVAASEKERAQTESAMATWQRCGVVMVLRSKILSSSGLERPAAEGESPVSERKRDLTITRVVVLGSGQ